MHLGKAIGIVLLGTAAVGAPFCAAQALPPRAVEVTGLRTFAIIAAKGVPKGKYFDRVAKRATATLENKGYRAATPGQVPDMLVKLSYGGSVLRYRARDLQFLSTPRASNTSSPHEPYPYPAGRMPGGEWSQGPLSYSPAAMELYVAVEISRAGGGAPLFEDGVRKRFAAQIGERVTGELVEAALEGFPAAGS